MYIFISSEIKFCCSGFYEKESECVGKKYSHVAK
jgi:hypothetical protein